MFTDIFYVRFDTRYNYLVYENDIPIYGKEIQRVIERQYPNLSPEERINAFHKDIDDAFKEYAKVCHIKIKYDSFSDNMKKYLNSTSYKYYLCEIQRMTRKEIFLLFQDADIHLLYEVASFLFTYVDEVNDSHED